MAGPELPLLMMAVVMASLVGSAHCVGMCGPFAVLTANHQSDSSLRTVQNLLAYHAGRGITYTLMGLLAGLTGAWFRIGGALLGWQQAAAQVTGIAMILFGIIAFIRLLRVGTVHFQLPKAVGRFFQRTYRATAFFPPTGRSFVIGLLTGFLPCGWLYAFVMLAVGTSHPMTGMLVMLAFWAGTIPALSAFGFGVQRMSHIWKRTIPYVTACFLIAGGVFTVSFRAETAFGDSFTVPAEATNYEQYLDQLDEKELPCCHGHTETQTPADTKETLPCCQQK